MLDDKNVVQQRDPSGALTVAANEYAQAEFEAIVWNGDHDNRIIQNIVVAGMGGSALAALVVQAWLRDTMRLPFEVVREYTLPAYVGEATLVIVSSCSGNTEETLACLKQARERGAQIASMTSGGKLLEQARALSIAHVVLPDRAEIEPRMTTVAQTRALTMLLAHFGVVPYGYYEEIGRQASVLAAATEDWLPEVTTDKNYAKQLALLAVGKTAVFYGGALSAPLAYKWKISWNENAKNVAFWNALPEFNHSEFDQDRYALFAHIGRPLAGTAIRIASPEHIKRELRARRVDKSRRDLKDFKAASRRHGSVR
jgi:glucose/mannose-6-phosphate isomerase